MTNKHTHYHSILKDGNEIIDEKKETVTLDPNPLVDYMLAELDLFSYTRKFQVYKNENTEVVCVDGILNDQGYTLTIEVHSCYCVPLNESKEPPF